jgi:hypothetical protein
VTARLDQTFKNWSGVVIQRKVKWLDIFHVLVHEVVTELKVLEARGGIWVVEFSHLSIEGKFPEVTLVRYQSMFLGQEEIIVILGEVEMGGTLGAHREGGRLRLPSEHGIQKGIFSC